MHRHLKLLASIALTGMLCCAGSGCMLVPDRVVEPQFHNPYPQLHRVAVLPFFNQSDEPTVDGEAIALAYYNELQLVPGFEVMPVGVAKQMLAASRIELRHGSDFQKLAKLMNVDAVLVGSVTDYSPYYPPRIGLAVDWYAANPGFHPIPAGYGLPWGKAEEEFIPQALVNEAEFALAREQLKTQTPDPAAAEVSSPHDGQEVAYRISDASGDVVLSPAAPADNTKAEPASSITSQLAAGMPAPALPPDWPDPRGFTPPAPSAERPPLRPQYDPIITHTRTYNGQDAKVTERLASYYYLRDDARFGGWSGYLQRPDDFARFCCYLHVTETLAARGGAGEARVVWRWPIRRYER
ncbi:MAG TPA: hypothetical protein VFV87_19650 [Pirellulaceae bacterium]|nr:hypothetical protein [Pirellulaceae bacterium]